MQRDMSQGIDTIPAMYDINHDSFTFRDGATCYEWKTGEIPFSMIFVTDKQGNICGQCADRALVLKHGAKQAA